METVLKIGELASATACHVETIRYYEKRGLLPAPSRSVANYRLYGMAHVERLQFIRHCRSLDMTLDEIGTLLALRQAPENHCGAVDRLLDKHMAQVATRIAELQALQSALAGLRGKCRVASSAGACGILNQLSDTAADKTMALAAPNPRQELTLQSQRRRPGPAVTR